jgi:hypothetical protein
MNGNTEEVWKDVNDKDEDEAEDEDKDIKAAVDRVLKKYERHRLFMTTRAAGLTCSTSNR